MSNYIALAWPYCLAGQPSNVWHSLSIFAASRENHLCNLITYKQRIVYLLLSTNDIYLPYAMTRMYRQQMERTISLILNWLFTAADSAAKCACSLKETGCDYYPEKYRSLPILQNNCSMFRACYTLPPHIKCRPDIPLSRYTIVPKFQQNLTKIYRDSAPHENK